MKPSRAEMTRLLGDSGYRSGWLSYTTLYTFVILLAVAYGMIAGCVLFVDSYDYIAASEALLHGRPHDARPPVYPLIIALSRCVAGLKYQNAGVVLVQWIVFIVSIGYFRRALSIIIKSRRCVFWATAFYAIVPVFSIFNQTLCSEGLCCSFVVFFLYCLFNKLPQTPDVRSAVWSGFWLIVLVFLRPVMVCMLPVYIFYWVFVGIRWRKQSRMAVTAACLIVILCSGSLFCYKQIMHNSFGINTISRASIVNNWFLLREQNAVGPECSDNIQVKAYLDSIKNESPWKGHNLSWDELYVLGNELHLSLSEQEALQARAISSNKLFYARAFLLHLRKVNCDTFVPAYFYASPLRFIYSAFPVSLSCYLVFLLLAGILLVWKVRDIVPWTLFLTSAVIAGAALVGSMNDWSRLFNPGYAPAWMLCAYLMLPAIRAWRKAFR
ncbi:MAG: glycosyltransferase family 39 protein [Candidatus Amulumruptor caecigallinarius]|nr:glycosyltransferase family 39 protein [Candidatus Amulumruptor caecigallinarius]MCM1396332.1 glycosyltransferase family 39 protein [Candidatus Amulumruptor caecigallinarius]MCM1453726.1 glycosyltransferase family 39 protein [bacterium]